MKILISGAGVAGPALAYWLLKAGHESVIVESAPAFRSGGYIIDFWGLGYEITRRMGLEAQIREAGYRVGEIRMVDRQGRRRASLDARIFEQMMGGRYISIPRGELARIIYQSVADRIETIFGDSITSLDKHANGVRVSFEKGRQRDFDLVIGADGLHSNVRRLIFGPKENFAHEIGYRVAAFEISGYRPRDELVYMLHAAPGKQIARFALNGDRTLALFVFAVAPGDAAPRDEAAQKEELRRIFAGTGWETANLLTAMEDAPDIYFDDVSQIRMPRWTKGRTALVGDAAACPSLLAGEGTGLAITQGYMLAGELAKARGDYRKAFVDYERRLRPFIQDKQKTAEKFASSFAPKTALGIWLRVNATRLMAFRPFAELFLGASLKDDFDLPDYGL